MDRLRQALRIIHPRCPPPVTATRSISMTRSSKSLTADPFLFEWTSSRWLFDEPAHLAARRVSFDVDALKEIACEVAQATQCTGFTKVAEGFYNKVYSVKFDTGTEVIARVPHTIAGPSRYVIASEVATMDFLRTVLGLPVPRVLAWSASNSRIGSAYIIMEKVEGMMLEDRTKSQPRIKEYLPLVNSILKMESRCLQAAFSRYGSLYYKEDVSPELQEAPLYADYSLIRDSANRFRIGPSTHRAFWRGERASMKIDRGPWRLPADFLAAMAQSEIDWINEYARIPNYIDYEHIDHPPAAHIDTLERYVRAVKAPGIAPEQPVFQPSIIHPDLNTTNIFTTSESNTPIELRSVIDWQHACVIPACLSTPVPACFLYAGTMITVPEGMEKPALPDDYKSLAPDITAGVYQEWANATVHKAYTVASMRNPLRQNIANMPHREDLFLSYVSADNCWASNFLGLRYNLAFLQAKWPGTSECPIGLTEDECSEAVEMYMKQRDYEADCVLLLDDIGCTDDGEMKGATQSEIDVARTRCAELAAQWDKETRGGPFPLRSGSAASIARMMGD